MTADGRLLTASQEENADLFWALRGAGANFGVVTSFEYRLHPVGPVLGGMILHPIARVREALRFYREFAAGQPDELTTWAVCLTDPDGTPVVAFVTCYAGPLDEGERIIAPLRGFGQPLADTTGPLPYTAMQAIIGASNPPGRQSYWKSGLTDSIADEAIDLIAEYAPRVPSPHSSVIIIDCHGAYARVGRGETAYPHRNLQFDLVLLSSWVDPADTPRNIGWTREFFDAIHPHLSRGAYVNDLGEEGSERARDAYGENYARLVALKKTYDPTNFFHLNQNIPPGE